MLNHPTHQRLIELGLSGMAKAFEEQRRSPDLEALPFEDRIGLLVDREAAERDTRRLTTRPQDRRTAPDCLRRRRRSAHPAGHRPRRFRQTRRRRLDRSPREFARHRGNRPGQKLVSLRARPQGLPRQPISPLSSRSKAVRGARAGARRRTLRPAPQKPRPRSASDFG
jgi:IstB-like ATP binding protein